MVVLHHEAVASTDVAQVLDVAEYLPMLLLEPSDRTDAFREQLVGLAQQFQCFEHSVSLFDQNE